MTEVCRRIIRGANINIVIVHLENTYRKKDKNALAVEKNDAYKEINKMSLELLEDCEDDNGGSIGISIDADSYAFMSVYQENDYDKNDTNSFILSPDEKGIENAAKIINVLETWIDRIKGTR